MKELIENLYPMNACLLGEGYDNRLEYIKHLVDLEVIEIPSGTKLETWTVPDEWVVRDAWVKFKGKKILDYKKNPLSLVVGSLPFHGKVSLEEFKKHLNYSNEVPEATPYNFKYYDKDWGFCIPKNDVMEAEELAEDVVFTGKAPEWKDKMKEGEYEVFIDTEYRSGKMKIGVHTIKGKLDKEVLLFAHLDHPFQANDNLSAVACLVDISKKIKSDYTVKIILCPETIGSIGYCATQDISKVEFVLAVDICGNDNTILLQKAYDGEHRINRVAHVALQTLGQTHRKAGFRNLIGSDEYYFNDPSVGIPGLMLSTWPYREYHTSEDTPEKINYEKIEEMGKAVMKTIEIWEKDFIPKRKFKGPLMRSKYDLQVIDKKTNLAWDYLVYGMDGKRSIAELCCDLGLNFDFVYDRILKLEENNEIERINFS